MRRRDYCILIGGGGHARVLLDCLELTQPGVVHGILDANPALWGQCMGGVPVLGGPDLLARMPAAGVTSFIVGVGSVKAPHRRQALFEEAVAVGLVPLAVRHPSVVCAANVRLGEGCQLLPGAIVNTGAVLGTNVIVNTAAVIEHDCVLGDHVHVASRAILCGTVTVGTGSHIGAGAIVRQNIQIGAQATVAAGAVVVSAVPDAVTVVGIPARVRTRH